MFRFLAIFNDVRIYKLKAISRDFECLLKKLNFPVIVSEVLEEEGLQTWCDDDLQLFSNDFQALSTFDISYPFMNRLLTLSPNYVP